MLSTAWAAAILALLVVVFFHEVVVGGKTFVSPDATAPAGFARIGERSLTHDHVYPQWNPYVFLGMPSFASGTYNPLIYPPDWPVALLQRVLPLPELTWMLLYYFVAGLGLFLLAREWGAGPEGALLGGVAFVFAPNLVAVGSHGHGSQLVDSAYLPLVLWLGSRWMRRGRLGDLAWLALVGGFQLLRGHVQICFYTWLALGGYTLVEWIAALRRGRAGPATLRAAGVAAAAALAFGLAGFYNLPLADYAKYSIRGTSEGGGVGHDYATQWSLAPYELPSVIVPGFVGFGGQTYWGGMPFTDYPNAYVGIVAAVLALLSLPALRAGGAPRVFALLLAVVSLLIAFGRYGPLYGLLYDHLPLFNKFRVPVMIVLLFQLAAALGLAWGWSALRNGAAANAARGGLTERLLVGSAVALGLGLAAGALGRGLWEPAYTAAAMSHRAAVGQPYPAELAAIAAREFERDLVRSSLIGLAVVAVAWALLRKRLSGSLAALSVLALLLIELWPVSGRVMLPALGDKVERDMELGRDDVIEYLEQQGSAGSFRIRPVQDFQSNRYAGFGIASLGGYHAAKPRLVQSLLDRGGAGSPAWLRLLNVRYVLLPEAAELPPGFREVHRGSQLVVENELALPRATVVGRYAVVQPDTAILDSVTAGNLDAAEWTYLTEDPHLTLGPVAGARATVVHYGLNDVAVDVESPGPALLRLADLWYPDWVARVDGRRTPLLRADYLLRAVPVPSGRHRVEFRFESRAIRQGLRLSLVSLLGVLVLFAVAALRRRSTESPAPEAS